MCTKIEHHKVDKMVDNIVHKPKYKKKTRLAKMASD